MKDAILMALAMAILLGVSALLGVAGLMIYVLMGM